MVVDAHIALPEIQEIEAISGLTVVATIALEEKQKADKIQVPDSPKPFEELQQQLEQNPILGGLLGGGLDLDF